MIPGIRYKPVQLVTDNEARVGDNRVTCPERENGQFLRDDRLQKYDSSGRKRHAVNQQDRRFGNPLPGRLAGRMKGRKDSSVYRIAEEETAVRRNRVVDPDGEYAQLFDREFHRDNERDTVQENQRKFRDPAPGEARGRRLPPAADDGPFF